jgi:DNA-binding response OmpR family regulator
MKTAGDAGLVASWLRYTLWTVARNSSVGSRPVVLLVEDEPEIVELMRDYLEAEGFVVGSVESGSDAVAFVGRDQVDCVLLDVMLRGESGFEVCRRLRRNSEVPVLFLTARGDDDDKIRGLRLGADDYVVKSASPAEVVERVKAVLRRSGVDSRHPAPRLRFGRLEIDVGAHEASVAGERVSFTGKEFSLLRLFVEHPRQVFSRDQLFELLWGDFGDRSAVGVYVRRLRAKIEVDPSRPELLVTVWGVGYRFDPPQEAAA